MYLVNSELSELAESKKILSFSFLLSNSSSFVNRSLIIFRWAGELNLHASFNAFFKSNLL